MLALYCRAENNRYFLAKDVEMRPGFLGKWVEFIVYQHLGEEDRVPIIEKIRERIEKARPMNVNMSQGIEDEKSGNDMLPNGH